MSRETKIEIIFNGKPFVCSENFTIRELLVRMDQPAEMTLIKINGQRLSYGDFDRYHLQEGDDISALLMVSGG